MKALIFSSILGIAGMAAAQTVSSPTTYTQTQSTGIVGLMTGQTAHLNLLNLSPTPATGSAVSCAVHVAFLDDKGAEKYSTDVTVDPGKSTSVDYTASVNRQPIRVTIGVSRPILMAPTAGSGIAMPVYFCSLVPTLEILEGLGGKTDFVVSDFHYVIAPIPLGVVTGVPSPMPMR